MHYGEIKKADVANGEGVRISIFVSGCRNKCKGCFNQITWDFNYGSEYNTNTFNTLISLLKPSYIQGLSILGGEPLEQENQEEISILCSKVKKIYPEKDIWLYTGYLFDKDLKENGKKYTPFTNTILNNVDILVDGKFNIDLADITLKFRGSSNQRIINVQKSLKEKTVVLEKKFY